MFRVHPFLKTRRNLFFKFSFLFLTSYLPQFQAPNTQPTHKQRVRGIKIELSNLSRSAGEDLLMKRAREAPWMLVMSACMNI